jgi:hypothetical protein
LTPVQAQWLTVSFIAAVTALVIAFDAWMLCRFGPEATISQVLGRMLARPTFFIAFVFWLGLLVGHIWLPAR